MLVTGANGYIGSAAARAFVRAGWTTYGLIRKASSIPDLAADEIIPLLGSISDPLFLSDLENKGVVFDVLVSVTEKITDYVPHYSHVVALLRTLAEKSNKAGVRPLVLFTSGCKDYGTSPYLANSPDKEPHTELTPLDPPMFVRDRAYGALRIFEHEELFDACVLRPTNVYGHDSSFYGLFFKEAEEAKIKGFWDISEDKETILHAMHVDDCGEAYVSLAECERSVTKGKCYNISASRYETLDELTQALTKEYGIDGGVRYVEKGQPTPGFDGTNVVKILMGFNQWVGSERLRKDTGWKDRRQLFSEGIHQYRLAYEVAIERGAGMTQNLSKRAEEEQQKLTIANASKASG